MKNKIHSIFSLGNLFDTNVISNEKLDRAKVEIAGKIIADLQKEIPVYAQQGCGPFVAAVYDNQGNLIAKAANTVVNEQCSNNHAEMNVIKITEERLGTYNLAPYNLKMYITAEPCIMCVGAIMWSGIKEIYYGVPTKTVEKVTGFDEGFKPHWFKEFKKRGIVVYGNIQTEVGKQKLLNYINDGNEIYKPTR